MTETMTNHIFRLSCSLEVVNLGGTGRFRLLTPNDYPEPQQSQDHLPVINLPPFKVWPTEFQLRQNERMSLNISYIPTEVGQHSTRILLLADDSSIREIVISASTTIINLAVAELEGVEVDFDALSQPDFNYLDFGAVPLGSSSSKSIVIRNKSSVAIDYAWQWLEASLGTEQPSSPSSLPFSVTPSQGRLDSQGTMRFDIMYKPGVIATELGRMVFVLEHVPRTCVPLDGQAERLEALRQLGETRLFRLDSWCRVIRTMDGGAMTRERMEAELFGPIMESPLRYRVLEVLDVQFEEGVKTLPVDSILALLPQGVKEAIEEEMDRAGVVSDEPEDKTSVESLVFNMAGSGDFVEVSLHPAPHYDFPSDLYPGKEYSFEVEVENRSQIALDCNWGDILSLSSTDLPLAVVGGEEVPCNIVIEPRRANIAAGCRQKVRFTVIPTRTGPLRFHISCNINGFPPVVWPTLTVFGHTIPPHIRFMEPEIDFGLLSVEGRIVRTLSFKNESDIPLKWGLTQVLVLSFSCSSCHMTSSGCG